MSDPLISMNHRRLSAGTYPSYANEGDPSWEDVVNMVVIPGNDAGIYEAAGQWDLLLTRVRQVQTAIDELKTGLESWEGAAGDTFRNHLTQLSTAITQVIDSSSSIPDTLRTAGDHVANTLNNTPIPGELVGEVRDAREQFLSGGGPGHAIPRRLLLRHAAAELPRPGQQHPQRRARIPRRAAGHGGDARQGQRHR